jgi:hypothetical protein
MSDMGQNATFASKTRLFDSLLDLFQRSESNFPGNVASEYFFLKKTQIFSCEKRGKGRWMSAGLNGGGCSPEYPERYELEFLL